MQSTTSLPRNYASTHLRAAYPGTCFDFSELMSFATLHPVDSFVLDPEECPSTTPCSEAEDNDDVPLELTYSGGTSKSSSTGSSSRMSSAPMTRGEQDSVIDGVISKLEGYHLGSKKGKEEKSGIGRDVVVDTGMRPGIVSEQDSMLWMRVWGSATAVRNAKERRGRRLGRKSKMGVLGFES